MDVSFSTWLTKFDNMVHAFRRFSSTSWDHSIREEMTDNLRTLFEFKDDLVKLHAFHKKALKDKTSVVAIFSPQPQPQKTLEEVKPKVTRVSTKKSQDVAIIDTNAVTEVKPVSKPTYKKKTIPNEIKISCWDHWIGEAYGVAKCYCCRKNKINKASFSAGHVIPESKGGLTTKTNLRPICNGCNSSMRTTLMTEYSEKHHLRKLDDPEPSRYV